MHLPNTSTCCGTIQVGIGNPSGISRRRARTATATATASTAVAALTRIAAAAATASTFAALSEINAQILPGRYGT